MKDRLEKREERGYHVVYILGVDYALQGYQLVAEGGGAKEKLCRCTNKQCLFLYLQMKKKI